MLQVEVLVGKLVAIDGLATGAIVVGEVSALEHEVRDHAVKRRALVTEPFFARAQSAEVLRSLGNDVSKEFERDATSILAVDVDVEENCRVSHEGSPYHRFGALAPRHEATNEKNLEP